MAIGAWACLFGANCSFIASRPPASAPDGSSARAGSHCGGIWYPLADTASVIAGATWVVHAGQLEDDSVSKTYAVTPQGTTLESESGGTSYQWMRVAGYSAMGLFGASALYGYVVEVQCSMARHEIAERQSRAVEALAPPRPDLPANIGGFSFGLSTVEAERVCRSKPWQWEMRDAAAFCTPVEPSSPALPIRLEFQAGTLHLIAARHRTPAALAGQQYDALYAALRSAYGKPQRERASLTGACATALANCLKNGEKPAGPAWYWPTGSLELQPVWQMDEVIVEERYTREESAESEPRPTAPPSRPWRGDY